MMEIDLSNATAYEAVRSLVAQQKLATDDHDEAGLRACYAGGVRMTLVVNGRPPEFVEGRDAVVATATRPWVAGKKHIHHVGSVSVSELPEGRMRARCYCLYVSRTPGQHQVLGWGDYDDECVLEDGVWRIAVRRATITLIGLAVR